MAEHRPNLFIVGAPRCGTSALHHYLAQHPGIFMSHMKEPHFFCGDINRAFEEYQGGPTDPLLWDEHKYLSLFEDAGDARVIGESSVYYVYSPEAARRIKEFAPDARIIVMLRDPFEFLRSLHARLVLAGDEECASFEEAIALEAERRRGERVPTTVRFPAILHYSRYVDFPRWLQLYRDTFGDERVKVVILEDMHADTERVFHEVLDFVGVPRVPLPEDEDRNPNREPRSRWVMRYLYTRGKRRRATRFTRRLERWNTRLAKRKPLDPDVERRMRAAYLPVVEQLSAMLDRDLVAYWGYQPASKKGLRVAITFPHSLATPGGGTHDCIQLARHMARQGADVSVLPVVTLWPSSYPRLKVKDEYRGNAQAAELAEEGVHVYPVEQHVLHYLLDGRRMPGAIDRLRRARGLDAVLGWQNETFFLRKGLREQGIVLAMNAAASYRRLFRDYALTPMGIVRRLRSKIFFGRPMREADVVFARSEFTKREIAEYTGASPERIRVAYLGIDPSLAKMPREPFERVERLLFFGHWSNEKGIFDTLHALGNVAAGGNRDWTLRIAGWGPVEEVEASAERNGISDRIEIVGRLERPEMLESLAWAQLAILPSHGESFGLANSEAQTSGIPVVAYGVAAVPEVIVDGETGWLVPFQDTEQLTEAVRQALESPEEVHRRGLAGRARMLREFSWERTAQATLAGLEDACRRRHPS